MLGREGVCAALPGWGRLRALFYLDDEDDADDMPDRIFICGEDGIVVHHP